MVHIRQIIFKNFSVAREMAQCLKVLFLLLSTQIRSS